MNSPRYLENVGLYAGGGGAISVAEALLQPPRNPDSGLSPPAPVIGGVWSALFILLGLARARVQHNTRVRRPLDLLWLLCVTYPLYTRGQRSRVAELTGNAVIGAQAISFLNRAARADSTAMLLVAPIIPWVIYATAIVLTDRRPPRWFSRERMNFCGWLKGSS